MNHFLYLVEAMSSEGVAASSGIQYTEFEIIFWYSAFPVVLILFILTLKHRTTNKKKMDIISAKVGKEISKVEALIKNIGKPKVKFRDELGRIAIMLSGFETTFVELKERTRLEDFDRLIAEENKIIRKIKKIRSDSPEDSIKEIEVIHQDLIRFKGQVDLVKSYLH